ncbi:MAG: molybdopterin-dependent oxidoreductase [Promethearchaeota archaeon]
MSKHQTKHQVIRTFCPPHCLMSCGILAHVHNGKLVKVEPAEFPDPRFNRICLKGLAQINQVYHRDRLQRPLKRVGKRGEGKWKSITWDEAFDSITSEFQRIMQNYGSNSIAWFKGAGTFGRLSDAPKRLASVLGGTLIGEGMGDGIDTVGPQASLDTFGTAWWASPTKEYYFGGSNEVADCLNSRLIVIWGANFAETAPHNMRFVFDAMEKGTELIVIDPRFSPTASKANTWIPIRPGTDTCLALGMINVILSEGLYEEDFLRKYTVAPFLVREDSGLFLRKSGKVLVWDSIKSEAVSSDTAKLPNLTGTYSIDDITCKPAFQCLVDLSSKYNLDNVENITGVDSTNIKRFAIKYATKKPASMGLLYGLDRWHYGNLTYRTLFTLMALTGQVGIKGGGFFLSDPTHCLNEDWWGFPNGKKPKFLDALQMYDVISKGIPYPIKAMWVYRGNFFRHSNANRIISEVLPALDFIIVAERFMTQTAQYADLVLPVCSSFETTDVQVGPFPYIQLQQKVIEPLYESKSDFEITVEVAKRLGVGNFFNHSAEEYIEQLVSINGITLDRLKVEGAIALKANRPHVSFVDNKFNTPSGRIEFYVERSVKFGQELPVYIEPVEGSPQNLLAKKYPLIFLQSHSRFHVHTSFANNSDLLEINPEPFVEINPMDAQKRDITDDDLVVVFNDRGKVKLKARLNEGVRPGVVDIHHGWWANQFREGSYQDLTHEKINPALMIPNFSYFDCLVEVKKARRD